MRENKLKKPNDSEEFLINYGKEFRQLIRVPAIAMCKHNNGLVPYEYANRTIRYKRDEEELDKLLATDLSRLTMYCFEKNIGKELLLSVAGGNLWDYYCMKKSFGGRG